MTSHQKWISTPKSNKTWPYLSKYLLPETMPARNERVLNGKKTFVNLIATSILMQCKISLSERSKSALAEEILNDAPRNYPLRRQSAIVDFKPKVSKWTKVKAAFKWEKANALPDDIHSTSSSNKVTGITSKCKEISPVNTEVARYSSLKLTLVKFILNVYLKIFKGSIDPLHSNKLWRFCYKFIIA